MLLLLTCVSWKLNFPIIIPFFFVNKIILISFVRKKKKWCLSSPHSLNGAICHYPVAQPSLTFKRHPHGFTGKMFNRYFSTAELCTTRNSTNSLQLWTNNFHFQLFISLPISRFVYIYIFLILILDQLSPSNPKIGIPHFWQRDKLREYCKTPTFFFYLLTFKKCFSFHFPVKWVKIGKKSEI